MEYGKLELTLPLGALQRDIQRAVDLVGFGLQAAEHATISDLSIPNAFGHVIAAEDRVLSIDEARVLFRSWVLANGLRECVEAVGPALEWARRFCVLWTRQGSVHPTEGGKFQLRAQFTGEEWNAQIVRGSKKFDRLPLPEKLDHLQSMYACTPPELSAHVVSLNATRNCLSHRAGIVSAADLKEPGDPGLVMRWRRLHLTTGNEAEERILHAGARVEAGELLTVGFVDAERTTALGERITLSPQDFVDVALTFLLFAIQLQASVESVQNRRLPSAPAPE